MLERAAFYASGDATSPVAICTLSSHALLETLADSPIAGRLAILGPLETENVGLERMIVTLLERPRIRTLIVCGDEARGRYQGQAVRALFDHGVDDDGRIVNARGRRARLPSLRRDHVDQVRRQVTLRDLVGVHDLDAISGEVERAIAEDPWPFGEAVSLPEPDAIIVPQQLFRLREHDPNGFFVILVDAAHQRIVVDHYMSDGTLAHRLAGPDAESLCVALVDWSLVSRLEHGAYLGRELMKAEIALRQNLRYHQDEPLSDA